MRCLRWVAIAGLLGLTLTFCFLGNSYQVFLVALVGLTTMVGIGLNVLFGLSGQVSLGQVGFYAIGAYTSAILTTTVGASFWLTSLVAVTLAGLVGTVLALPALRVTGPYLAMVTIAFGFIIEHGTVEWRGLTGGANGLLNIPLPSAFGYSFDDRNVAALIVGCTAIMLWLFWRLSASPWGLALRAVRDAEVAAQSLGLNPLVLRTVALMLSAVAAGLAGALFAPLTTFVSPSAFPFVQSILFFLAVIIGGAGMVFGPLIGAALRGLHRPVTGIVQLHSRTSPPTAHRIASAGLILVPEGRQVFPELTVLDNIRWGAYCRRGFDASQDVEPLLACFPALKPRLHTRAGLLSGGEQQMLAIARGMAARPMLLLLDEPSLGLAPTLTDTLFGVLAELRNAGITVLLVDQRVGLALAVADRGYVLQNARMVQEGSAADIHNVAALERAYLGEFA
jgi:ABC-type branched-subunit amino acid transport system permease subunit